ncbi:MAG: PDZ domain-containing protein [Blastocatellia bacterium]
MGSPRGRTGNLTMTAGRVVLWLLFGFCGAAVAADPGPDSPRRMASQWGYVGVYLGDLTSDRAKGLGLGSTVGAIVGKVEPGSPAEKAGLREDDCLLALDGEPISNRLAFFQRVMNVPPGTRVRIELLRAGARQQVEVELGGRRPLGDDPIRALFNEADAMLVSADDYLREANDLAAKGDLPGAEKARELATSFREMSAQWRAAVEKDLQGTRDPTLASSEKRVPQQTLQGTRRYQLGLTVIPVTDQLARFFHCTEGCVLVSEVRPGGAAEQAGIRAGDCLTRIGETRVPNPLQLSKLLDQILAAGGGSLTFQVTIVRQQAAQTFEITL